jgi:hypothetical protein
MFLFFSEWGVTYAGRVAIQVGCLRQLGNNHPLNFTRNQTRRSISYNLNKGGQRLQHGLWVSVSSLVYSVPPF